MKKSVWTAILALCMTLALLPGTALAADGSSGEPYTGLGSYGIAGIVQNPAPMPFTDVTPDNWFYRDVDFVWKHYLMSGVSPTVFEPQTTTSRAMIWTVLARMQGVQLDGNSVPWYESGRNWAMREDVSDGADPQADVTREQLVTMLWRSAGQPAPGTEGDMNQYSDSGEVSGFAGMAVRWAVSVGLLRGYDGKLDPQGTASRAQIAALVTRYGEFIP